jgi:hypothetical protein
MSSESVAPEGEAANWSEAWARAVEKADAAESSEAAPEAGANAKTEPEAMPAELTPVPAAEAKAAKAAKPKAEPAEEPEPEADADADAEAEAEGEAEGEAVDESEAAEQLKQLAKKLGLRVDATAVTTEERVGFRAEKRKWREKRTAEEVDLRHKLQAAEEFYQPMLKAKEALEAGDYDAALVAMGLAGGISEANQKIIERESGKDPRVESLKKELEAERRVRQEREAREAELHQRAAQERAEREALTEISGELGAHPHLAPLGGNEWFARGVLKVQQEHWDGYETLSVADAAIEHIQLLRNDPRAKMAYEALQLAFGGRSRGKDPERPSEPGPVDRSDEAAVRLGKPPKTLSKRKAAEAGAPPGPLSEEQWMRKYSTMLKQATVSD